MNSIHFRILDSFCNENNLGSLGCQIQTLSVLPKKTFSYRSRTDRFKFFEKNKDI